jgi:endonuclease/exonuclease/phosphatase (EEP) superfamily protein YafD
VTSRATPVQRLLAGITLATCAAALGSLTGTLHWFGDMLAMVADYYVVLLSALLVAFLSLRRWFWASGVGAVLLITLALLGAYPALEQPAATPGERNLRLLVYNIYHLNPDLAAVVAEVQRADADLVFLMEYSHAVQQQIEPAFAAYPYRLIEPSRFTMGLALFSRIPFETTTVHRSPDTRIPIYEVQLQFDGQPFTFVGGHPWPPQPRWGQLHRDQMADITAVAARSAGPLIVAGDFNAAPWSFVMRDLAAQADVRHVRAPLDLTKTWRPLPFFGLPVDHVLLSDAWQVTEYRYSAPGGSDHTPLIIDLVLPS